MKFLTGAIACGLMIAGFATSTPALAMQDCKGCVANFNKCIAAGGSPETCWTCNNPTCSPYPARDALQDALGKLSPKRSGPLAPASKRAVAVQLDS